METQKRKNQLLQFYAFVVKLRKPLEFVCFKCSNTDNLPSIFKEQSIGYVKKGIDTIFRNWYLLETYLKPSDALKAGGI